MATFIPKFLRQLRDVLISSPADGEVIAYDDADGKWKNSAAAGGGAPDDATYLVTAGHAGLSAEVAVGATPGGELGGTWASPTVDATHSGSSHAAAQAAAEATAAGELATHSADTTGVHGIADTSALALTANHPSNATFNDHSARHENGGADEITLAGLDGISVELAAHIADATAAHTASAVSVLDTAGDFTATEVEGALAELHDEDMVEFTQTFEITASGDDAWVYRSDADGTTWPPDGSFTTDNGDTTSAERSLHNYGDGLRYYLANALLRFDTSSLPDDAVDIAAQLRVRLTLFEENAAPEFVIEWYPFDGSIATTDWTATPVGDANPGESIAGLIQDDYNTFDLINVAAEINLAGYTGLRCHVDTPAAPGGRNAVVISTLDHATHDPPRLIVTYGRPAATVLEEHLADTVDAHDASAISILDTANDFAATEVESALAELQAADEADEAALAAHLADASDAHDASAISFSPTGTVAATDVQAAIAEVASEAGGGAPSIDYETRSTNTILGTADKGKTIDITATITQTFEADETLGDGWWVILRNATDDGTTILTLNPAGAETIDGLTTVTMYSGEARLVICNGSGANFNSILLEGGFARFTTDQNFTVPHGITQVVVECIGGGGGGAGGRGAAAANSRAGGSAGGGGSLVRTQMAAAALGSPGDAIAVDVAGGGTSGAGGSSAVGVNGGAGGNTTFGSLLTGYGGGAGLGGTANVAGHAGGGGGGHGEVGQIGVLSGIGRGGANIVISAAVQPWASGGAGGTSTAGAFSPCGAEHGGGCGGQSGIPTGPGGTSTFGGGGGGGGGWCRTSNAEDAGAAGGDTGLSVLAGGGGGTAGAVNGGAGGNGAAGDFRVCGEGGGGGGGQDSGTGGVGGTGGAPGGGGGGGGGGTTVGGAGGVGGIGECRVWYS